MPTPLARYQEALLATAFDSKGTIYVCRYVCIYEFLHTFVKFIEFAVVYYNSCCCGYSMQLFHCNHSETVCMYVCMYTCKGEGHNGERVGVAVAHMQLMIFTYFEYHAEWLPSLPVAVCSYCVRSPDHLDRFRKFDLKWCFIAFIQCMFFSTRLFLIN